MKKYITLLTLIFSFTTASIASPTNRTEELSAGDNEVMVSESPEYPTEELSSYVPVLENKIMHYPIFEDYDDLVVHKHDLSPEQNGVVALSEADTEVLESQTVNSTSDDLKPVYESHSSLQTISVDESESEFSSGDMSEASAEEETEETSEVDIEEETEEEQDDNEDMEYIGNYYITGYCMFSASENGGRSDGLTASGVIGTPGYTVAMKGIPFGTIIYISGLGYYEVQDRGVGSGVVDVACDTKQECYDITGHRDVYIVH